MPYYPSKLLQVLLQSIGSSFCTVHATPFVSPELVHFVSATTVQLNRTSRPELLQLEFFDYFLGSILSWPSNIASNCVRNWPLAAFASYGHLTVVCHSTTLPTILLRVYWIVSYNFQPLSWPSSSVPYYSCFEQIEFLQFPQDQTNRHCSLPIDVLLQCISPVSVCIPLLHDHPLPMLQH